jgi:asparagine synthase (glutamine-hydrolysing)
MLSPSGRFAITFNGEIYNYRDLRAQLQQEGRTFATTSDTEVILHLAESSGIDALAQLEGMFAFALFDRAKRELLLIRDRLGIKPLFWVNSPRGMAFASEPKALRGLEVRGSPDAGQVGEYLAFRHLAEREAFERGIETLLPGQRLKTDGRTIAIESWWSPYSSRRTTSASVDDLIGRCVRRQLVSDVPVGTFLSGGIDSALVTAHAAEALPTIDTFTVSFSEEGWDESDRARQVATAVRAKAHNLRLDERTYVAALRPAIWHLDGPLNHAHSPHLMELSKLARRHITVALTGEGSDELFAGYPRYRLFRAGRALRCMPDGFRSRIADAVRPKRSRWARLLDSAISDPAAAAAVNSAFVPIPEAAQVAGLGEPDSILSRRLAIAREAFSKEAEPIATLLDLDRRTYLVSLLQRMDRMTMAAGLEARVPLLDEEILYFSLRMDPLEKMDLRDSKKPIRRAAEQRFGRAYAHASKFGFGVPLSVWMRGEGPFSKLLYSLLEDRRTRERGWLDVDLLQQLYRAHRHREIDASEILWGALNLELYARICVEGAGLHGDLI